MVAHDFQLSTLPHRHHFSSLSLPLCSQFENIVRKHHEVHQAIGRLNMPLKKEIIHSILSDMVFHI